MPEEAALAVRAVHTVVEGSAFLRFVFFIAGVFLNQLVVSMCELALLVVAAEASLNPVLAHFGLVLGFVSFGLLKISLGLLKIGANGVHSDILGIETAGGVHLKSLELERRELRV